MKKKLLCMALILCTVLTLVPAFMMAASGDGAEGKTAVPDYDDLYVTDGLVAHFVADEESVDLATGTFPRICPDRR